MRAIFSVVAFSAEISGKARVNLVQVTGAGNVLSHPLFPYYDAFSYIMLSFYIRIARMVKGDSGQKGLFPAGQEKFAGTGQFGANFAVTEEARGCDGGIVCMDEPRGSRELSRWWSSMFV